MAESFLVNVDGAPVTVAIAAPQERRPVALAILATAERHSDMTWELEAALVDAGFAVASTDLVTKAEVASGMDAGAASTARILRVIDVVSADRRFAALPVAVLGIGARAAAALAASARRPGHVRAVALLGPPGEPLDDLRGFGAPVVFLIEAWDVDGLRMSRRWVSALGAPTSRIVAVPDGASVRALAQATTEWVQQRVADRQHFELAPPL